MTSAGIAENADRTPFV